MGEVIGAGELHKGVKLLIDGEPGLPPRPSKAASAITPRTAAMIL